MPLTHNSLTSLFSDIADAIRAKTGGSSQIVADDFPTAIASISGGGGGTVTITDTTDTHGGTIRTITTNENATTVIALNATSNNTYTAPSGYAYSPVVVNVAGGGYTLLGSAEFTVNTTSTSATTVGYISCGSSAWDASKILMVTVKDKAGKRSGYFTSSISFFIPVAVKNGNTGSITFTYGSTVTWSTTYGSSIGTTGSGYGVFAAVINDEGRVTIQSRYNSTYSKTINGTYACEVWALDYPTGFNPWGD